MAVSPLGTLSGGLSGGDSGLVDNGLFDVDNKIGSPFTVNFGEGSIKGSGQVVPSEEANRRFNRSFAGNSIGNTEQMLIIGAFAFLGVAIIMKMREG